MNFWETMTIYRLYASSILCSSRSVGRSGGVYKKVQMTKKQQKRRNASNIAKKLKRKNR